MERTHCRTLIEEGVLPTVPRWRSLVRDLRFWKRLVAQVLCRFALSAASRWFDISTSLSTQQRRRKFWLCYERSDPACETPVRPRSHPYTVEALAPARFSPPVRRRHYVRQLHALRFSPLLSQPELTCAGQMKADIVTR